MAGLQLYGYPLPGASAQLKRTNCQRDREVSGPHFRQRYTCVLTWPGIPRNQHFRVMVGRSVCSALIVLHQDSIAATQWQLRVTSDMFRIEHQVDAFTNEPWLHGGHYADACTIVNRHQVNTVVEFAAIGLCQGPIRQGAALQSEPPHESSGEQDVTQRRGGVASHLLRRDTYA